MGASGWISTLGSYGAIFDDAPALGALASYATTPVADLCSGDLAHSVVEGQAQDLDKEVDSVAGQITIRPAPVAVFEDQTGIGGQNKIAGLAFHECQSAFVEQRRQ